MSERVRRFPNTQTARLRRNWRKGIYIVPSLLTTANIFCGFIAIMESLLGNQWIAKGEMPVSAEHFNKAALAIGFAALFDLLDGRIARMTNTTSEFGIELDSIADVVSFGVAPAVLAYTWGYGQMPQFNKFAWAVSFLFLICGALRLARYNVQARQTNPNLPPKNPKEKKAFVGMPIPAGAYLIAAIVHFYPLPLMVIQNLRIPFSSKELPLDARALAVMLLVLVTCLAFLMVSTIRYSSLGKIGSDKTSPRAMLLGIVLIGLCIWFWSDWSLLILATAYVSHGVLIKLWSYIKPRRHDDVEVSHQPSSEARG